MGNLALFVAIMTVVLGQAAIQAGYKSRELPQEAAIASAQVGLYRAFMVIVQQYVIANPGYSGTLTWSTLKAASTTPDSMKNLNLNSTWKAIADGTGNFVICAQLSEQTTGALGQLMPASAAPNRLTINGQDYVYVGDATEASSKVTQCL
ncbi:hypothetical protein [Noviherbaspirillum galbum]|uniref:Uncharacterized protein n=1 Tax=Noviherbaspirillum galbum TaxID=2709383 RepID=A0A6B3SXT8_9BURK|nr:hypothetical protein [Noviherbaspirillum galbum]NEX63362.1 hypothetical protein [Noviherbaspirillum galbum]